MDVVAINDLASRIFNVARPILPTVYGHPRSYIIYLRSTALLRDDRHRRAKCR